MLRKFGYGLVVMGALMLGVGVNTVFVGCKAFVKEKKCEICGHLPLKPEEDCRCDCHHRHK